MIAAGFRLALALALAGAFGCSNSAPAGTFGSGFGGFGGAAGSGASSGGAASSGAGASSGAIDGSASAADAACGLVTCQRANANCGPVGDGCGGVIDCGTCATGQTCGGGGMPSQCGLSSSCMPRTCAEAGANCGPVSDGCGALLQCGTCATGQSCGGGGVPSVCGSGGGPDGGAGGGGSGMCTPRTCAQVGANCGPVSDGCGALLQCGTCMAPDICGGGGTPNVCGGGARDGGMPACTGLCTQQVPCPGGGTTTVSGTVVAPTPPQYGTPDPLYNALVYVPNGTVRPFPTGVSCDQCGATASGNPLVTTVTGANGQFRLENVPVGANIPLVIQLGRWRRQVTIPRVTACQDNPIGTELTRLPRNKSEGDIPLMAMMTGDVDPLECVLRKIGIDDAEFTAPGGNGRVQIYLQNGATTPGALDQGDLWANPMALAGYDLVILACQGSEDRTYSTPYGQALVNYTNSGGRVFATHWNYGWLDRIMPFQSTAQWVSQMVHETFPMPDPMPADVDTSFPKGAAFAQWLGLVGALSSQPNHIRIYNPRHDLDAALPPARQWISSPNPVTIQHYTFNTPVNAPGDLQCGRVVFSDFHVTADTPGTFPHTSGMRFPTECRVAPLTPQEKIIEFMLFDLSSCIAPDAPSCTPRTCAQQNLACGPAGDGCGGVLDCGNCQAGQTCGGGGVPGQCGGGQTCTPRTCAQQNLECGPAGNGCGGVLDCGTCTPPLTCGGGGVPGRCGNTPCVPRTCAQVGAECGIIGDGCGGQTSCGQCVAPDVCGVGGPNKCGTIG